jgi:hypothetical protein
MTFSSPKKPLTLSPKGRGDKTIEKMRAKLKPKTQIPLNRARSQQLGIAGENLNGRSIPLRVIRWADSFAHGVLKVFFTACTKPLARLG